MPTSDFDDRARPAPHTANYYPVAPVPRSHDLKSRHTLPPFDPGTDAMHSPAADQLAAIIEGGPLADRPVRAPPLGAREEGGEGGTGPGPPEDLPGERLVLTCEDRLEVSGSERDETDPRRATALRGVMHRCTVSR